MSTKAERAKKVEAILFGPSPFDEMCQFLEEELFLAKEECQIEDGDNEIVYLQDCERIVQVARRHGIYVSIGEASSIWSEYSNLYASGWLNLPENDDDLWAEIGPRVM